MTRGIDTMTHQQALSTMASERYLLEEMPELERHAFEEHFFSCADCAEDVRTAELMRTGAREMGDAVPERGHVVEFQPRRQRPWLTAALPWAAAASLALVAGYQQYQQVVTPGLDRPYALAPVTLRPANRGADAIVKLGPGDPAIALAIDADAPAGLSEWLYELRGADGAQVAAGRISVQAPGTPLLMWVPASTLDRPGRYTLSLRDREDGQSLADYQFAVSE